MMTEYPQYQHPYPADQYFPRGRENPQRPFVYQSPIVPGWWRTVANDAHGDFQVKSTTSIQAAYAAAVRFANGDYA